MGKTSLLFRMIHFPEYLPYKTTVQDRQNLHFGRGWSLVKKIMTNDQIPMTRETDNNQ